MLQVSLACFLDRSFQGLLLKQEAILAYIEYACQSTLCHQKQLLGPTAILSNASPSS